MMRFCIKFPMNYRCPWLLIHRHYYYYLYHHHNHPTINIITFVTSTNSTTTSSTAATSSANTTTTTFNSIKAFKGLLCVLQLYTELKTKYDMKDKWQKVITSPKDIKEFRSTAHEEVRHSVANEEQVAFS